MNDLPDLVPNHLQMPNDTYSGFMLYFYIDIQIQLDTDIHQRIFLDDRLVHDNVFYNISFLSLRFDNLFNSLAFSSLYNFLVIVNRQRKVNDRHVTVSTGMSHHLSNRFLCSH